MDDRTTEAFWKRVRKVELTGCWVWTGYINPKSRYGTWTCLEGGKTVTRSAHRLAYELLIGPVPRNLVLDHLCMNRSCCNPEHLEPITQAENILRGSALEAARFRAERTTHCPNGHEYTERNTRITPQGSRSCRTCARENSAVHRAKRIAENPPPPRVLKPTCKRGHEFTPENTYVIPSSGARSCKECKRAQVAAYRAKPKAEVVHQSDVCKNGHAMDEENSSFGSDGTRSCRACSRERSRDHARRVSAAAKAAGMTVRDFLAQKRTP